MTYNTERSSFFPNPKNKTLLPSTTLLRGLRELGYKGDVFNLFSVLDDVGFSVRWGFTGGGEMRGVCFGRRGGWCFGFLNNSLVF